MEQENMESILREEFQNDPLYRLAILSGLENDLFTENIVSMHKEISYSTVETGKIIDRADSSIRNHFRSELKEYIAPEKFGKFFRLNYVCVFKLHLIFILIEKASKTTVDLLAELGMHPGVSIGSNVKRVNRNEGTSNELQNNDSYKVEERINNLERGIGLQSVLLNIYKYEKDLLEIDHKIESNRASIKENESNAYLQYLEDKNNRLLTESLRRSVQKPSIFNLFKKGEEVDVNSISSELESALKEKMLKEIEVKNKELKEQQEILLSKKDKINTMLNNERTKFDNLQELESFSSSREFISAPDR